MNIRRKEKIFFSHAITIISRFIYSVFDEKVTIMKIKKNLINHIKFEKISLGKENEKIFST